MSKELGPESNISDLVNYLLEKGIDVHIIVPDDRIPSLQIRADCENKQGKLIRNIRPINMVEYKSAPPCVRNLVLTLAINELVNELERFQ